MEKSYKIIRKSIYTFLQNYQYLTSILAFLILPYSASILVSQALISSSSSSSSSSLFPTIYARLKTLFDAAGFPPSLQFFIILNQKLSQTISSCLFTLPFTLTFLLISKSFIIQSLNKNNNNKPNSTLSIYYPILITYIYNSFLILSANATVFTLLFFAFNFLEQTLDFYYSSTSILILSASGAVLYSIVIANTLIICNLALVLSGIEKCSGYLAILKACVMIRGRTSTALCLALPLNLGLAAIESLFHYRIVTSYHKHGKLGCSLVLEGSFIAYLYAILVVLDTIVNYMFYKSCKIDCSELYEIKVVDQEEMEINGGYGSWKTLGPLQFP